MAIIYSYPKQTSLQSTDLLISTRFSTEPGVVPKSISFSLETLGEYINANHPSTLNQVLTAGNQSLLDAKVGSIYLYDTYAPAGYLSVRANKNRIYFYGKNDIQYGYITQDSLFLYDNSSVYGLNISIPSSLTGNRIATFQDATGTVAYLDDLSSLTLDQVLNNGNTSIEHAYIGELGLWDNAEGNYVRLSIQDSVFNIVDSEDETIAEIDKNGISFFGGYTSSISTNAPTANRQYNLPNKSGTIALTDDIPATNNYGLATQIGDSEIVTNVEKSLISSDKLGTLTIPADTFKVGDCFKVVLMGHITCSNNDRLRIKVKASGGAVLADTLNMDLSNSSTDDHWKLEIDFTVRKLGGTEVAAITSGGSFYYNKGNNNIFTKTFLTLNDTDFNTKISNTLDITGQFETDAHGAEIYSSLFTLTKTY